MRYMYAYGVTLLGIPVILLLFATPSHYVFATVNDDLSKVHENTMTPALMEEIIRNNSENFSASGSMMRFSLHNVPMLCIYDTRHDRMRIIASVIETEKLSLQQYQAMMEANFHHTLDARYATSNGVVYAAYLHTLSSLQPEQLASAINQVAQLVKNFGTSYSSGELSFGNR